MNRENPKLELSDKTMDTCAEFLIDDPRLGEPSWNQGMPRKITEVSIEMLRPIRDAMTKKGFIAGEITRGKPWGSGCDFGEGKSRVSVFSSPRHPKKKSDGKGAFISFRLHHFGDDYPESVIARLKNRWSRESPKI